MTFPNKRSEMMFTERCNADVLNNHHLIVLVARKRHDVGGRILVHSRRQFGKHLRDTTRRFAQSSAFWVLAEPFENQTNTSRNCVQVHRWALVARESALL